MEEVKDKKTLGQLLHDKRVSKINKAYASYRLSPDANSLNDLLKEVTNLAQKKLRGQAEEFGDVGVEDDDDYAQKVTITVWEKLPDCDKSVEQFYPWVMKIIINHRMNMYRDLLSSSQEHAPFSLQDEEGNEYDNPDIYTEYVGGTPKLPEGLSEEEQLICYMLMDGYKQERIAEFFGVGLRTIERRINNLKKRYKGGKVA